MMLLTLSHGLCMLARAWPEARRPFEARRLLERPDGEARFLTSNGREVVLRRKRRSRARRRLPSEFVQTPQPRTDEPPAGRRPCREPVGVNVWAVPSSLGPAHEPAGPLHRSRLPKGRGSGPARLPRGRETWARLRRRGLAMRPRPRAPCPPSSIDPADYQTRRPGHLRPESRNKKKQKAPAPRASASPPPGRPPLAVGRPFNARSSATEVIQSPGRFPPARHHIPSERCCSPFPGVFPAPHTTNRENRRLIRPSKVRRLAPSTFRGQLAIDTGRPIIHRSAPRPSSCRTDDDGKEGPCAPRPPHPIPVVRGATPPCCPPSCAGHRAAAVQSSRGGPRARVRPEESSGEVIRSL